ncbi:oxidoreductase [Vibrio phage VP-1]|uniref:Oxidoreductase n=1 Tax=Vibrio phage VP-1 TaxID=2234088 RepID=A0A4P2TEA6_9CAUD|nr:oxidoreductase [Vibrio phage VP-1]
MSKNKKYTPVQEALSGLSEYCTTTRQTEQLEAVIKADGNQTKAARALGISHQTVSKTIKRLKAVAASKGWSPDHDMRKKVPEGFGVKGTSTLYGKDGELKLQWVKTQRDAEEQFEILQEVVQAMCEDVPRVMPTPAPSGTMDDLEVMYSIGDHHLGMLAWEGETGQNHNLQMGQDNLINAVTELVRQAPSSTTATILNVGDFFHADTPSNRTEHSGNPLDVDSRWGKIVRIGVNLLRQCIDIALTKHEKVKVFNVIGNHDTQSAYWLAIALSCLYENEPRVEIVVNPSLITYHQFGKNLFGFHHGHTIKAGELESVMAYDCADLWSQTKHRYWHLGHFHHQKVQEYRNVMVEVHSTLTPGDAWHYNSSYRSESKMVSIIYHKEHGEVGRAAVRPEMFK